MDKTSGLQIRNSLISEGSLYYNKSNIENIGRIFIKKMELILYHGQSLLYKFLIGLLLIRIILNYIIYKRIDSSVTQPDVRFWRTVVTLTTKEKEELAKRRPNIVDVNKEKGSLGDFDAFTIALTFWWPKESFDDKLTKRLKKLGNILNILFLLVLVGVGALYLYMQDINMKYHHIKQDWTRMYKTNT